MSAAGNVPTRRYTFGVKSPSAKDATPEEKRAYQKAWRAAHPLTEEQKARARERAKAWRHANNDRVKATRATDEFKTKRNARERGKYATDPEYRQSRLSATQERKDRLRDEINARNRELYATNPERAAKGRANSRAWRRKNPERVAWHWARWHAANPETPEQAQARWNKRRARLMDGRSKGVTPREWTSIVEHFGGACAYCLRSDKKLTRDHVIPLNAGGLDDPENVVPACLSCNSSKRDFSLPMWVLLRGEACST